MSSLVRKQTQFNINVSKKNKSNIKSKTNITLMPPKKIVEAPKVKLGRPGNTLKMGIVGLPNVGKSTTFNLLSNLSVPAENYPFCTIDPNLAKVSVDDERLDKIS